MNSAGLITFFIGSFLFFSTFSIAGTQTALTLSILLWIVLAAVGKAPRPRRTTLDFPIILFVGVCLVAVLFSKQRWASFVNLKNILLVSIVYLLGFLVRNRKTGHRLFAVLLFSGAVSSLYGIAIFLLGKGEGTLGRTPGTFSTAMTFGGVLLMICSLFFSVGIGNGLSSKVRVAVLGAALASAGALFFSFTRSSWLGMIASCIVILAILRRKWLLPFVGALLLFTFLLPVPMRERVTSIWDARYRTNVQRLEMLWGGWRIFKDHPVIGVGTMDLGEIYRRYKPPEAVYVHGHMHNNFFHVAVTTGAIGLGAFCFLLFSFYRLMAGNLRLDLPPPEKAWVVGSIGALTGFIVNGLFEWNFGDAEVVTLLYLIVGSNLAIAVNRRRFVMGNEGPNLNPLKNKCENTLDRYKSIDPACLTPFDKNSP
ncbi:MAG: O-antigen ligase family protein [Candidatus Krumholzibacteria bacterium]|nr:O-antigen ligase family protein [Candidatus Krumholzibacteria bacterium]